MIFNSFIRTVSSSSSLILQPTQTISLQLLEERNAACCTGWYSWKSSVACAKLSTAMALKTCACLFPQMAPFVTDRRLTCHDCLQAVAPARRAPNTLDASPAPVCAFDTVRRRLCRPQLALLQPRPCQAG